VDAPDLTGSIVYSIFDNCENCNTTTTTTSTTTIGPTTTTTTLATTTTTTTTEGPPDNYYFARAYTCDGTCAFAFDTFVKMNGPGIIGKVYREPGAISLWSYELLNVTPITTGTVLSNVPFNSCLEACTNTPGTTTTTTAATTTTTTGATTTSTTSTTTLAPTLFYISNGSLDIIITDVKVNGVTLTGLSGGGFPIYPSENVNGTSTQFGAQNVDVYFSQTTTGQHIESYDSDLVYRCTNTGAPGSDIITFVGAAVGAGTFQISALDGSC
jgi:hypothetical protein